MGVSFTICVLGGVLVPGLPIRHQTLESGFLLAERHSRTCGKLSVRSLNGGSTRSDSQFVYRTMGGIARGDRLLVTLELLLKNV